MVSHLWSHHQSILAKEIAILSSAGSEEQDVNWKQSFCKLTYIQGTCTCFTIILYITRISLYRFWVHIFYLNSEVNTIVKQVHQKCYDKKCVILKTVTFTISFFDIAKKTNKPDTENMQFSTSEEWYKTARWRF